MAVTNETNVVQRSGRRRGAIGELIEEAVDLLTKLRPVVGEAMGLEHVAAQPMPQLLDGVEPGGGGRQPDGLEPRQLAQRRQHVVVVMDRPIILYNIDAPRRHVDLLEELVEGADLLAADPIVVEVVQSTSNCVEGTDEALLAVRRPGRS